MLSNMPQTPPSASDDEFLDVTAAIVETVNVPPSEDPEPFVKLRLRDEADKITIGETENKILYANAGAFRVFEDLNDMKRDIIILKARDSTKTSHIEELRQNDWELRQKVRCLESRVRCLVQSSEGYLAIRRRFLDVYKRDIKMQTPMNSKAIHQGNISAYEGDALGDAALFERDKRTDLITYRELYGLEYHQVLDFSTYTDGLFDKLYEKLTIHTGSKVDDESLLMVLNAHGTMVAQGKSIPNDLKDSFNYFLGRVEEVWPQRPTEHPNSPLHSFILENF